MLPESDYKVLVSRTFTEMYGSAPALLVRAPGRINLIGEHTDYNEGLVFPAAIDKEIVLAISPSTQRESSLFAVNLNRGAVVNHSKLTPRSSPSWINFFTGMVAGLQKKGFEIPPFNCAFGGDIPNGAGLSSSAALEVGFGTALQALFGLKVDDWDIIKIAQQAEHEFVGVKCGIMDMFASKMGRKGHAMLLDCHSLAFDYYPVALGDYRLLLIDTQVKHSLANSEYNTRRLECELGISLMKNRIRNTASFRDLTPEDVENCADMLSDIVYKRCRFVTGEIERTKLAAKDLKAGNLAAFGKKLFETHRGLSDEYEVSCRELDFLVNEALRYPGKVLGARMMGGGFGGCTLNIVHSEFEDAFKEQIEIPYTKTFQKPPVFIEVALTDGASVM